MSAPTTYEEFHFASPVLDLEWSIRKPRVRQPAYDKPLVQRDPRTPLSYKIAFSWVVFATCLFSLITAVGLIEDHKNCTHVPKAFSDVAYVALVLIILMWLLCIMVLIRKNWMWMTYTFTVPPPPLGEDVEDDDPFILGRTALKASEEALQAESNIAQKARDGFHALQDQHQRILQEDLQQEQEETQRSMNDLDQ